MSIIPSNYKPASLRVVTPVSDGKIGVGFNLETGDTFRVCLGIEHAKALANLIRNHTELGEHVVGTARPRWLCRWWLRTRDCKRATLVGEPQPGFLPVQEFFVPWWAWPLELLHRSIFGGCKMEKLDESTISKQMVGVGQQCQVPEGLQSVMERNSRELNYE